MNGLYYYKLQSPYPEDVTKNCKLTINEIDSNFLSLKNEDIKNAIFDRNNKTLVITRNDGDAIAVNLDDITYDLNVSKDCTDSGVSLTITYDGKNGQESVVIDNIITADTLKNVIDDTVLTKVITDGTLSGNGTITNPLGINGTEKTGVLAPVKKIIDLTNGDKLPSESKKGTRYLTIESVNDYGYLYNVAALTKIANAAKEDGKGWRVPTKADWDALLNSIEPCAYSNHESASCHVELGKYAGKYLKSECGWIGQEPCSCSSTKPMVGSCDLSNTEDSYVDDTADETPSQVIEGPQGIDKYGLDILPSGYAYIDTYNTPKPSGYKEIAAFWTTSHVYNDENQDIYVKEFDWNKSGVMQNAQCADIYYGVRLVKDYDGTNYLDTEYIDGVAYKTVLMAESKQVWLASNYAKKEGFVQYEVGGFKPEVVEVNNGEVSDSRKVLYINEWNGKYWEKRAMHEGEEIIVEDNCSMSGNVETKTICWGNENGEKECVEVEIPVSVQNNLSYRVYTTDSCNQELVNVDDLAVERILNTIIPIIEEERKERLASEEEIKNSISAEASARAEAIESLTSRVEAEEKNRKTADTNLFTQINEEVLARASADTKLQEAIDAEANSREEKDDELSERIDALSSSTTTSVDDVKALISAETIARETADEELDKKITAEKERAEEAEKANSDAIDAEVERAKGIEAIISGNVITETERATAKEIEIENQLIDVTNSPFILKSASGNNVINMILPSKDGLDSHAIKIILDGNFGEI